MRLRWEGRDRGEHAGTLRLCRESHWLRRYDTALRVLAREGLRAEAGRSVLRVVRAGGSEEPVRLANISDGREELALLRPLGSRVLSTAEPGANVHAPWSAVALT